MTFEGLSLKQIIFWGGKWESDFKVGRNSKNKKKTLRKLYKSNKTFTTNKILPVPVVHKLQQVG